MEISEIKKKIIEEIINDIECARAINYHAPKEGYEFRENWLKSLRPQNWKPSDEEINVLDKVIDEYDGYPEFDSLVSLKNNLKKKYDRYVVLRGHKGVFRNAGINH